MSSLTSLWAKSNIFLRLKHIAVGAAFSTSRRRLIAGETRFSQFTHCFTSCNKDVCFTVLTLERRRLELSRYMTECSNKQTKRTDKFRYYGDWFIQREYSSFVHVFSGQITYFHVKVFTTMVRNMMIMIMKAMIMVMMMMIVIMAMMVVSEVWCTPCY